jgi:uncharacterized membrane protein YdbT with pleckstrin-like domain
MKRIDMECVDDDEILLGTIYKHAFGIIIVYIQAGLGLVLSLGLAFFLLPSVLGDTNGAFAIATTFAMLAVIFAVLIILVATIIYRQSHLIITDKNITQVLQGGLFQRKVSQLTMANVEDVTSEQRGFFASIFDFGVLKVETAGEQENFHFNFCPKPSYYAKIILEAREKYVEKEYPYAGAVQGKMSQQQ